VFSSKNKSININGFTTGTNCISISCLELEDHPININGVGSGTNPININGNMNVVFVWLDQLCHYFVFLSCFADNIFWDPAYVLGLADWDVLLDKDELKRVSLGLKIINDVTDYQIFMYNHYTQLALAAEVFKEDGASTVHPMFVYKANQNMTGTKCYIYSVETVIRAVFGKPAEQTFIVSDQNPLLRHNLIMVGSVNKFVDPQSLEVVNPTEKPPQMAEKMWSRHGVHGGWALVLCSGAGGDVLGLVRAGANVMCIDKDEKQCASLVGRLRAIAAAGPADRTNVVLFPPNEKVFVPARILRSDWN
jgi:hypothetical protein